jgi:hypothetical protein
MERKITFSTEEYIHPDTQLRCELFVVTDEGGNRIYERDYGHIRGLMSQYIEDYYRYVCTFGYSVSMSCDFYNTTETGY